MHNLQNGVYFGSDGYYLQNYKEFPVQVNKNIGYVNELAGLCKGTEVDFMLVPNSISVMSDKLPAVNTAEKQQDTIER